MTEKRRPYGDENGFSMVEIMVAMLITVVVMASVFGLLYKGQENFQREPEVADLNQNARAGLERITKDLTVAGYKTPPVYTVLWKDGGGLAPDELTIVYADPAIPLSQPVTGAGGQTIKNAATVSIDPDTFDPPQPTTAAIQNAYTAGMTLFAFETDDCNGDNELGITPFEVTNTGITNTGGSQTLNVNKNPGQSVTGLNPPAGFQGEVVANCTIIGAFRVVMYRIDLTDPEHPTLDRNDLGVTGQGWLPVVANVDNLQVQFAQGTDPNFVDVPVQPDRNDPNTWITRVAVTVAGRSDSRLLAGNSSSVFAATGETHLRKTYSTTMSLRNQYSAAAEVDGAIFN